MFELRDTKGRVLYASETAKTFRDALTEAVAGRRPLPEINLDDRDLAARTKPIPQLRGGNDRCHVVLLVLAGNAIPEGQAGAARRRSAPRSPRGRYGP